MADGVVYVASHSGCPYNVFASNARTGDALWQHKFYGAIQEESAMVAANGMLYVSTGALEALNAKTGTPVWQLEFLDTPLPPIAGGVVFVSAADGIYALDANTGPGNLGSLNRLWLVCFCTGGGQ